MTGQVDRSGKSIQKGLLDKTDKTLRVVLFIFIMLVFTRKPLSLLYSELF